MAEKQTKMVLVDKDLRPAYYDDFHCLAADCQLSCCKGWNITFDKKDYLSLKRQQGSEDLNQRMKGGLRRLRGERSAQTGHYGEFVIGSGSCPLLRDDCLCALQAEKGHEALPYICQVYPRSEARKPSGYLERSLSPSCEAVLALLWDLPEGIDFRSDPLPTKDQQQIIFSEEEATALWFPVVREWCIDRLQDRRFPLGQRILIMGMGLQELAHSHGDIQRWMERAVLLPENVDPSNMLPTGITERLVVLSGCLRTLLAIVSKDPEFIANRSSIFEALHLEFHPGTTNLTIPMDVYQQARDRYQENFKDYDYFMENLMVTLFFHLRMPHTATMEEMWKDYVNFCNLYSLYHFMAVMSCREGAAGDRAELFRQIVLTSRELVHNYTRQTFLRDQFFERDNASLAHMAILLCD